MGRGFGVGCFGKLEYVGGDGEALDGLDKALAGQTPGGVWRISGLIGRLGGVCCREWLDGGVMGGLFCVNGCWSVGGCEYVWERKT